MFLALEGNRTLGREESRPARLLDQRDACKLHIVCHYVQVLLGPGFPVVPVGRLGQDEAGRAVRDELLSAGLEVTHVATSHRPTLFSVCFLYPDGDGGNITTSTSASSEVSAADVAALRPLMARHPGRGVALALPEVPLEPRLALLAAATEHGWLRVAAVVPDEVEAARERGLFQQADLLALNVEEAAAVAGVATRHLPPQDVAQSAVEALRSAGCRAAVVLTAGAEGSWVSDGDRLVHSPAVAAGPVVGTAGAGDAHLAAVVVGLVAGVDLPAANSFAALVSGLAVTSPHSIDPDLGPGAVVALADRLGQPLPAALRAGLVGARR
jgi:ribokinase